MKTFASLVCSAVGLLLCSASVQATSSKAEIEVMFGADTRDIHFKVGGHLTDGQEPRPDKLKGLGGFESEINNGDYNAAWSKPPGAGTYVFTLARSDSGPNAHNGGGVWDGRWWLTTDGKLKSDQPKGAATFSSLYIDDVQPGGGLYAENASGLADVTFMNVVATVIDGLASYDLPTWDEVPGTSISLPDTFVPAGSQATFVDSIGALGSDQWLRLSYSAGGVNQVFAYNVAAVPEPGMLALSLVGVGLMVLTRLGWRDRRDPTV